MSDDFVNLPLRKQTNRENPLSRIERLEKRTGARSSATAVQLSQISGNTGDLVVDGSIKVINRETGNADVTIDDFSITFANQEGQLAFEDSNGDTETVGIFISAADSLTFKNAVGGKVIVFNIDDVAHSVTQIQMRSDGIMFMDTTSRIYYGSSTNTPMVDWGTYTPTVTAVTNVDSASADADFMYTRVGNMVQGYGSVSIDPTAGSGTTRVEISLPIASNFAAATDAVGGGSAQVTNTTGSIAADTTDDRLALQFQSPTTASMAWRIWFMYQIL
jgi:hypothetical protein